MKVAVSARVIDRNVGGNSRYARTIHSQDTPYESILLRPSRSSSSSVYAPLESFAWPLSVTADVLHFPADTGAVLRGKVPIITTVHGLGYRHVEGIRSTRAQLLWRKRVSAAVRASDHVITVSRSSADDIVEEFGKSVRKITVIPHGVDGKFQPGSVSAEERAALGALGFPETYMLYVGNIEPRKNLIELVRASQTVFEQTGVPLVIAGAKAWDFDETIAAVDGASGVHYVGRLPEELLVAAYRGAELFCFPSKYEGFGLPVLEAMATGTPVACTLAGSLREVSEGAAFAFPGLGADDIAPVLHEAMSDATARAEIARAGLARAATFSWAASIDRHAEVFEEVAR